MEIFIFCAVDNKNNMRNISTLWLLENLTTMCYKLRCKKDTETKIRFGSKFTTLHQKVMRTAVFEKHSEGEDRCYALI